MNKSINCLFKHAVLILIFGFSTSIASAGEHILIPKFGIVVIEENTNHLVDSSSFDFDDDNAPSFGFSYLYKLENGFSFGVDLFGYEKDIVTTVDNRGDASVAHIYAVAEKFFNNDGAVKPYVGLGLGSAVISFDANVNGAIADDYDDSATGFSYELFVGIEVEITDSIGMTFEYKYFDIDINDDIGVRDINFESDGDAIFVGVSVHI